MKSIRSHYAWLWLLVALQIAIPASYYARTDDLDDERFAWRIFSDVRLKRCKVSAFDHDARGEQPIDIRRVLHGSWIAALERGRRRVIERFLATRCALPVVSRASLERRCRDVNKARETPELFTYDCRTSSLRQGLVP